MPPPFEPGAHPTLASLGRDLRDLAGDAAYQAGREYLRKGLVKQGAVAGMTAYATVSGSTDYRVSIAFSDEPKVTCTCPAHRRKRYCKHVVAVCTALLERPLDFPVSEAAPPAPAPAAAKRKTSDGGQGSRKRAPKPEPAALRAAGLETVDRLLVELAEGGLMSLGPEKMALLAQAGELVRALKLRRLGNRVLALQRAASAAAHASGAGLPPGLARQHVPSRPARQDALEPARFAAMLTDLYLAHQVTAAQLEGRIALDEALAEDLLGKTWRENELESVQGLELLALGYERESDGEFLIETGYLAELSSGELYLERQISPLRMTTPPLTRHRLRLVAEQAGLYPGPRPRRIKLIRSRRAALELEQVVALVERAPDSVAELRRRLLARLDSPFGDDPLPTLFRPSRLVVEGGRLGAVDGHGAFLALECSPQWAGELPALLDPADGPRPFALLGLLQLTPTGLSLRCLSVFGALRGGRGPIYPEP